MCPKSYQPLPGKQPNGFWIAGFLDNLACIYGNSQRLQVIDILYEKHGMVSAMKNVPVVSVKAYPKINRFLGIV
jgi:hypothetical protein